MVVVGNVWRKPILLKICRIDSFISSFIINIPTNPANKVIMVWLRLPTIVNAIPFNRCPSSRYTTLPTYSPIRFGVFTANDCPVKTALNAFIKEILSIERTRTCHFLASMPQFTNINRITSISLSWLGPVIEALIISQDWWRSSWCWISLYKENETQMKRTGPRK